MVRTAVILPIALIAISVLPALRFGLTPRSVAAAPQAKPGILTLSFVGDILLSGTVGELIEREGPQAPWEGVRELLGAGDLTCGNLECAVGTTGTPVPGKAWTFRAAPESIEGLVYAGVDVVSLANNHALDYGTECLLEGVQLVRDAGIAAIGAGANDTEARQPFIFEKNGLRVGILATAVVVPHESWAATKDSAGLAVDYYGWYPGIIASIKELSPLVDAVIVVVHWGEERATEPVDWIMPIARAMREAGAHAIIGSHPHVLEGIYYDGQALTAYSLGNFVFSTRPEVPECQVGAILNLTVSKGKVEEASVIPTRIVWGKTVASEGADKDAAIRTMSSLSRPLGADVDSRGSIVPLLFTDMNDHWARFTVGLLAVRGAVQGYEDLTFRPDRRIPKEEFAAMFSRAIATDDEIRAAPETEGFSLCDKDFWGYPYLSFLASRRMIPPDGPGWAAGEMCTRLDASICMWKHARTQETTGSPPQLAEPEKPGQPGTAQPLPHPEVSGLGPEEARAISWAMGKGILRGYPDGSLQLQVPISRAEVAEMLLRYLDAQDGR